MLEQKVQAKIINYLTSIGAYNCKVIMGNRKGIPDILVCYKGRFIGLEVKRNSKSKPSPLQLFNLKMIKQAGGRAEVVWSIDQVENLIGGINASIK